MNNHKETKNLFNSVGIIIDDGTKPVFTESLPMFYYKRYNFREFRIEGYNKPILLLELVQKINSLVEIVSNLDFISRKFSGELVVKFEELPSFWRMQLIKERIPFIVQEEVYLPFIGALLKPNYDKRAIFSEQFTPAQQHIFIGILILSKTKRNITPKDLSNQTQLSMPTIYRSLDLMANIGIYNNIEKNKHNSWSLAMDTANIWNTGKDLMISPVIGEIVLSKEEFYKVKNRLECFVSGNGALAYYTNLEEFETDTYAISISTYKELVERFSYYSNEQFNSYQMKNHSSDFVTLEVWSYGPIKVDDLNKYVDPISLYLINRKNPNARVQSELDNLLEREFTFEE